LKVETREQRRAADFDLAGFPANPCHASGPLFKSQLLGHIAWLNRWLPLFVHEPGLRPRDLRFFLITLSRFGGAECRRRRDAPKGHRDPIAILLPKKL
jgi:hypothetical protein